jgi:putative acetyltransferase
MYTRSYLLDESDNRLDTITFGPVSVLPEYQKKGVGSLLIGHSMKIAADYGYKAVVINGHPHNYCRHGFRSSKDLNVSDPDGKYPYSLLVSELKNGISQEHNWRYYPSDAYNIDIQSAEEFDKQFFDPKKKEYKYSQEEFSIACRAFLV